MIESEHLEREGLRQTVAELLATAEIIPLTGAVLQSSAYIEAGFGLTSQDAIVLASVLSHLEANVPAEGCFLNL